MFCTTTSSITGSANNFKLINLHFIIVPWAVYTHTDFLHQTTAKVIVRDKVKLKYR